MQLCRFDAAAPPIVAAEASGRTCSPRRGARRDDLRHRRSDEAPSTTSIARPRAASSCWIARSATGGMLDLKDPAGRSRTTTPVIDGKGLLYVTGDDTKKVEGGKLVPAWSGFLRAAPSSKVSVVGGDRVMGEGCKGLSVPFAKGYDPTAPAYGSPRVIGFLRRRDRRARNRHARNEGDHQGRRCTDATAPSGSSSERTTARRCSGASIRRRVAGDDLWSSSRETRATCESAATTRAGTFVQTLTFPGDGLQKSNLVGAGDDKLWNPRAVSGDGPKDKYGTQLRRRRHPGARCEMSIARSRSLMVAFAALVLLGGCKAKQGVDGPTRKWAGVALLSAPLPAAVGERRAEDGRVHSEGRFAGSPSSR